MKRIATLAALAAALSGPGCAARQEGRKPDQEVVWPRPPETARIKYVRSFGREQDLQVSGWRTALRTLVPTAPDALIKQPTGMALSPDESLLYLACPAAGRVVEVDLARSRMRTIGPSGPQLRAPYGVAVDAAGLVYASDRPGNRVVVLDKDGKIVRRIGEGVLDQPQSVAIDRKRELLYVVTGVYQDKTTHRIEVFRLDGTHLRTVGTRGHEPGTFNFPSGVTVGPDGTVYVVDMLNFRVQLFDPQGALVGMFGGIGVQQAGKFDKAKGLALDTFGNLYVTDSAQGVVQIFNDRFQPLLVFGGRASAPTPGLLFLPNAIVIDSRNTIYVADFVGNGVSQYQLVNTTAADSHPGETPAPSPAGASQGR
jgi:sugar lactone lactonase YvrE